MTSSSVGPSRETVVLPARDPVHDSAAIARAAAWLQAGKLVAFPTETVYGLGADATNARAVAAIFAAKMRPLSDPLIVHLADASAVEQVVLEVPTAARELARHFWPGPLTLVLRRAPTIPAIVAAGGATIGVRVPAHPVARALIAAAGVPIAAPSANRFMHTSPTSAAHVLADLDGRIDGVLDGGVCGIGVESTVLDLTVEPPALLRPGGIALEALRALLGTVLLPAAGPASDAVHGRENAAAQPQPAHAPGQMERHYAPAARLEVVDGSGPQVIETLAALARAARERGEAVGALVPNEEAAPLEAAGARVFALGPSGDLDTIAHNLYAGLRALDDAGMQRILCHTFGNVGLGLALRDRLRRAAGGNLRAP